jgi:hypothetical protein
VSDTGQTREQRQSLLIDSKLDSERIGEMTISGSQPGELVGVKFASMLEVMEFAKLMALADTAVPPHLRNKPGSCLAVTIRALQLQMDPFTVANWSYEVEQKGVKRISYEAAFYNAVILARAPIDGPLEYEILGEGDERKCKVTFTLRRRHKTISYISEKLGKLRPGRNESGTIKGSPLWEKKPEVQMIYNTVRDVARIYFPHVTAGLYTSDELADFDEDQVTMEQPTAGLLQRLQPRATDEGFNQATTAGQFDEAIQAARAPEPEIIEPEKKPRTRKGGATNAATGDDPAAEQAASSTAPRSQGDAAEPQGDKNGT